MRRQGLRMRRRWCRRRSVTLLSAAAALAAGAACGGGAATGRGTSLTPDVIYADEIATTSATNAYDAIDRLRPNWLRGRGTTSIQNAQAPLPVVYLGDRRQGDLEILRSFAANTIAELRFINATTATTRYGNGHAGGVIRIVLKAG